MSTMSKKTIEASCIPTGLTIRAVEYDQYGDASVLHLAEHAIPQRLPDQLLIEVHASSVNPIHYLLGHCRNQVKSCWQFHRATIFGSSSDSMSSGN